MCAPGGGRLVRAVLLLSLLAALAPCRLWAQPVDALGGALLGSIEGVVTTQGNIPLGGALVTLTRAGAEVAQTLTDGEGTFRFDVSAPGEYTVLGSLQGFDALSSPVAVALGRTSSLAMDLRISTITDSIDVVAPTSLVPSTGTLTASEGLTRRELEEITGGGGLQSTLRLLASVIEVPGGLAIKGGSPSQATTQLGPGAFVDPATGMSQVELPDDAIDSVTVLPNPYAVEYGRFSSGLVLIQTRRAGDVWRTRINKLEPAFRNGRGEPFHILGIGSLSPRVETGGPIVKDRLFLQQAAQYRLRISDVPSRPQTETRTSHRFSSYTRIDANVTSRHSLVAAVGWFPASGKRVTLGTFTPAEAAVNTRGDVSTGAVTERAIWNDELFSETTVEAHGYATTVLPRGSAPMEPLPETTLGNFFNRQFRETSTFQVIETVSGTTQGVGGLHQFKAGVDVLHSRFNGTSASRPVLVRRSNGTLARRLDFGPATEQMVATTDLAVFVQDRVQPTGRFYVEIGGRLDRDGVVGRFSATPRVGSAILLDESGGSVIRTGFGVFYERTPSVAGAFEQYESFIDRRFAADGATPLGPGVPFSRVTDPDLRTSRSTTWDLAVDHRLTRDWAVHLGVIDRRGSQELVLDTERAAQGGELRLASDGRSRYREAEFGAHYTGGPGVDVNVSYVFSRARADINAFTSFFDNVLVPVVGENGYGPARGDAPHRLVARGRALPLGTWLLVGVLDWRSGLPYSAVNEWLDFVGPRNDRRFPDYLRVDLGVEHRFTVGKYRPWIGVRVENALNSFVPTDVQANISSPAFGTFYNSPYRQFRIQVRFER